MDAIIKPTVQALLVCDTVIVDSLTGKKSLIGIFTHLLARSFPCQHPQMGVYFCLTDAQGTYHFEIRLNYLDHDRLVGKGTLPPVEIHDRLAIHDFALNIAPVIFPGPGRYEFALYGDGQFITQKDFHVIWQGPPRVSEQDDEGEGPA